MNNTEFTKEDLERVALLSRLHLSEQEKEKFFLEIKEILGFVEMIKNISNINNEIRNSGEKNYEMQFINSQNKNRIRKDLIDESSIQNFLKNTEKMLKNSPKSKDNFVIVSQVLDKHKK